MDYAVSALDFEPSAPDAGEGDPPAASAFQPLQIIPPHEFDCPVVLGTAEQADSDDTLLKLWLGRYRSATTLKAYRYDAAVFFAFVGKLLREVRLADVQRYAVMLAELREDGTPRLATATQARRLASLKSLASFATKIGYLQFDIAAPIILPRIKDTLAERILEEGEVQRMISMEANPRNHLLLRFIYATGVRLSEACAVLWRDLKGTKSGGQATIFGKGDKTRVVLILPKLWRMLATLRGEAGPDDPVFRSREGGRLDQSQVHRIVKAAAKRAGLPEHVSCHWLQHAHASHALAHGAGLALVQKSFGHASPKTTARYVHIQPGEGSATFIDE